MAVLLRATKGSNLTPTEADANLTDLQTNANSRVLTTDYNTALALKAPLASPTFTGTVSGVTKAMVGLTSVDDTADTAKPVSTAQQTALDLKKTDSMATNKLLGRGTGGTGVIEEIILGTNLSFTGTTLNAASGGASDDLTYTALTASQASYALDMLTAKIKNYSIVNNTTAVTFSISNMDSGDVINIWYAKSTVSDCGLTFPTTSYINYSGIASDNISTIQSSTVNSLFFITIKKIGSIYSVSIDRYKI